MPTDKDNREANRKPTPERGRKNSPLTSWTVILALLGAGAMPCPDCGMPLAWHLWPLALLILAARWITGRRTKETGGRPSPKEASEPGETPHS